MSVVIEVIQPDGTRVRHRLNGMPLTLGRSLTNDIIVDDPYVDATHARLTFDEIEGLIVEDLGSVNGVIASDERRSGRINARPGEVLRLGRTTLRIRDPNESVPPALVEGAAPATLPKTRRPLLTRTTVGLLGFFAVAVSVGLNAWLGSSGRSTASDVMSATLGAAALLALWAGLWSIASRIIVHRFRFTGHLAVASTIVLLVLAWNVAESWLQFLFPDMRVVTAPTFLVRFAALTALAAGHLSLVSTMPRRRQWRVGLVVSGVVVAISALSALTRDDSFTDVPKFPAMIKPVPAALVPTKSISQFEDVSKKLRADVDLLAKK